MVDEISLLNNAFIEKGNVSRASADKNKKKMLLQLAQAAEPAKISPKDAIISSIAKALPMLIGYAGAESEGAAMAAKSRGASGEAYLQQKRADAQQLQKQAGLQAQLSQEEYERDLAAAEKFDIKGMDRFFKEGDLTEKREQELADDKQQAVEKKERANIIAGGRKDAAIEGAKITASARTLEKLNEEAAAIQTRQQELGSIREIASAFKGEKGQLEAVGRRWSEIVDPNSKAGQLKRSLKFFAMRLGKDIYGARISDAERENLEAALALGSARVDVPMLLQTFEHAMGSAAQKVDNEIERSKLSYGDEMFKNLPKVSQPKSSPESDREAQIQAVLNEVEGG